MTLTSMYNGWTISYFGNVTQNSSFFAIPGIYEIECWGAQGSGKPGSEGGKGGYVRGFIRLYSSQTLFIYVGEQGKSGSATPPYNGGGHSQHSGGGASDVRLIGGEWNNIDSLKSRIIVAGAGGGGDDDQTLGDQGGAGGGTEGFSSLIGKGKGGKQFEGGEGDVKGSFGKGGGNSNSGDGLTTFPDGNGAGGGGYFGGGGSMNPIYYGGGGGSSFISGHPECQAINNTSTNVDQMIMLNSNVHYSGLRFFRSEIIDGNSTMPSPFGQNELGHSGDGAVRITYHGHIGTYKSYKEYLAFLFIMIMQAVLIS